MGGAWAEKHLPSLISHVLDLAYHTRTTSTHIDAVYSRKCVSFILRFLCGKLLSESAQLIAAKHLCSLVCQRVAAVQGAESPVDPQGQSPSTFSSTSSSSSAAPEKATTILQHLLICSILEVSALVCTLNTAALPLVADENAVDGTGGVASKKAPPLLEALGVVLLHHSRGARLAGAWCLRCVGVALPSQLSRLLDFCLGLMRGSPGAVYGSAYGMAALMGTVRQSELGMPSAKAKVCVCVVSVCMHTCAICVCAYIYSIYIYMHVVCYVCIYVCKCVYVWVYGHCIMCARAMTSPLDVWFGIMPATCGFLV